jgi:hypothetical protein
MVGGFFVLLLSWGQRVEGGVYHFDGLFQLIQALSDCERFADCFASRRQGIEDFFVAVVFFDEAVFHQEV